MKIIINEYLLYLEKTLNYSPNTIKSYQKDLTIFHHYLINSNIDNLDKIDYQMIRDFLYQQHQKKLKATTINRQLSAIRSFFKYLIKQKIIKKNPLELISNSKTSKHIPDYLHYYEFEKLLMVPNQDFLGLRDRVILELLYSTGIRVNELINIKTADIDLNNMTIKVFGKGRKERIVLFGKKLKNSLEIYLHEKKNNQYLIINKNGGHLSDRGVRLIIDKIVKQTDLKKNISPHTFRHTFATHMLDAGADLKVVQELLGHESIGSTGIYTHVSNEKLREEYRKNHPRAKRRNSNG